MLVFFRTIVIGEYQILLDLPVDLVEKRCLQIQRSLAGAGCKKLLPESDVVLELEVGVHLRAYGAVGRLLVTVGPGFAESDSLLAKKNG